MLSTTSDASAGTVTRTSHAGYRGIASIAMATAILLGSTQAAIAQTATEQPPTNEPAAAVAPSKWEFLIDSGVLFPTGAQRGVVKQANITAAQLSYVIRPHLAITGTVGWARARDIATVGNPRLDIFTYDVGAEFRPCKWLDGHAVNFSPFGGIGMGGRTYNYHSPNVDATHNLSGYVSAGGEFGRRRLRLRVEARDYVTGFQRLNGVGSSSGRNDVVAMIGLRIAGR
jgi:hypothetical protein